MTTGLLFISTEVVALLALFVLSLLCTAAHCKLLMQLLIHRINRHLFHGSASYIHRVTAAVLVY